MRISTSLILVLAPAACASPQDARLNDGTLAGIELRSLGPALMSGRIADLVIDPDDTSSWYVAVGSGGVWKTTNAGTTWTPIFDDQGSYSIGCIALDPSDSDVVWVGTGENVGGRHVGYGDGIYKSLDGGQSWTCMGLEDTEHIGTILIDPRDPDVVFVAAQGPLWTPGGQRGLYRTGDGGVTWELVLAGANEWTGVNEVIFHPDHPEVMWASTHQRHRTVSALVNAGPGTGIWKSTDSGITWREVESGLPSADMGRIGLAVSPFDPEIVYATIELAAREGGFYRSGDGGETWEKRNDYISGGTGPHYYQEIFASPHHFETVYQADVWMRVTKDGGSNFARVGEANKHSDNHALAFHPDDPDYLLAGCDGGIYESFDLGATWKYVANLPITQFYKVAVDDDEPFYNVYGGTQDNNSQGGPSRTDSDNGIRNADWFITLGGDGHDQATEPGNPDIVYSEWQEGHLNRFDRRTGETVDIQPQPGPGEDTERYNWDAPILVSPHSPTRLYFASQRVWRSDDRGDSWTAISGDLTSGVDRLTLPVMGRVWSVDAAWDLWAMSKYASITSLAESPVQEGVIYAGTDDGRIQVTADGGETWTLCGPLPDIDEGWFVNDVKADLFDANVAYACVDQHKIGDFRPHVFRTDDRGQTWTSIAGDLPDRHLVWRLEQDHVEPDLLFLGTEFGVFFTLDGGEKWVELEGGVPNIPFRDIAIQRRENDLVGATFGRGFYVLDDYSFLRELSEEALAEEAGLFSIRDAHWYIERSTLGGDGKAYQGDAYYYAENPPFGAVFTYYLRDSLQTAAEARREAESAIAEEGGDTPTPGWDVVLDEDRETEPAILLVVRDSQGRVVRRVEGPTTSGFHRVAWDLRYPSLAAWAENVTPPAWGPGPVGFMAPPGSYSVSLAKRVDGIVTDLGLRREFQVVPMREGTLPAASADDLAAYHADVEVLWRTIEATRATLTDELRRVGAMADVLGRTSIEPGDLEGRVAGLRERLLDLRHDFLGNDKRENAGDPGPVSVMGRFRYAYSSPRFSSHGPTQTQRASLDIARNRLAEMVPVLQRISDEERPALEAAMDAAGAPWTPGRAIPSPGRR